MGLRDSWDNLRLLRAAVGASTCRYCIITDRVGELGHFKVAESDDDEEFCRMLLQLNSLTATDVLAFADGCDRKAVLDRITQLAGTKHMEAEPDPAVAELKEVRRLERTRCFFFLEIVVLRPKASNVCFGGHFKKFQADDRKAFLI